MPSFDIPTSKIAPGSLPGPRITPDHVAPVKGIANATNAIQKVAGQYIAWDRKGRDQFDENRITEVLNNSRSRVTDAMIGGDNPLYFRKGSNAFGSAGEGGTMMDQIRDEAMESLTSQRQKDEFMRRWPRVSQPWTQRLLTNESRQGDVYTEEVLREEEASLNDGTRPIDQLERDAAILERKKAKFRGTPDDPDTLNTKSRKQVSNAHRLQFIRLIQAGKPMEALEYQEDNWNSINGEDRAYMESNKEKLFRDAAEFKVTTTGKAAQDRGESRGEAAREESQRIINQTSRPAAKNTYVTKEGVSVNIKKYAAEGGIDKQRILRSYGLDDTALLWGFINSGGGFHGKDPEEVTTRLIGNINAMVDTLGTTQPEFVIAGVIHGQGVMATAMKAAGKGASFEEVLEHLPEGTEGYVAEVLQTSTLREEVDPVVQRAQTAGAKAGFAREQNTENSAEIVTGSPEHKTRMDAIYGDLNLNVEAYRTMTDAEIHERYDERVGTDGSRAIIQTRNKIKNDPNEAMIIKEINAGFQRHGYFRPTRAEVKKDTSGAGETATQLYDTIHASILADIKAEIAKNNGKAMSPTEVTAFINKKVIPMQKHLVSHWYKGDTVKVLSDIDIMRGLNKGLARNPYTKAEVKAVTDSLKRGGYPVTPDNVTRLVEEERMRLRNQGVPQ